jgi:hypothetical protein
VPGVVSLPQTSFERLLRFEPTKADEAFRSFEHRPPCTGAPAASRAMKKHTSRSPQATYADAATIKTACGAGFPRPPEVLGDPPPGDAYVAAGHRKSGKLIIDLATRKVVPR